MSAMFTRLALVLALVACRDSPAPRATPTSPASPTASDTPLKPSLAGWRVPAGWRTEVISFPLDFAPSLAHRGFEELRFPPGMFDPAAPGYWSYAFVWRTDDDAVLDAAALSGELTAYFRCLIAAVDEQKRIAAPGEITATATGAGPRFEVRAHVFDAFKTAQPVELAGWAERRACSSGGALWIFVLARDGSPIRAELDTLAGEARC
jgi:hypothetical protein